MKKLMQQWINFEFKSSSGLTPEFQQFARDYKVAIKKLLPSGAVLADFSRGHFEASGFIMRNQKHVYFSASDVRYWHNEWHNHILVRTANGLKDYTGGSNNYTTLDNFTADVDRLLNRAPVALITAAPRFKSLTVSELKKAHAIHDLEGFGLRLQYEIGGRGGNVGFSGEKLAELLEIEENWLPRNYGAYCNYLGGGIRGSISGSGYSPDIPTRKARILDELAAACKRAYINAENGMNDETDENGETNWDAVATNASRKAGVVSAY